MLPEAIAETINLNLEILSGCRYSCNGCTIEKNFAPLSLSETEKADLLNLVRDSKANGVRMLELKLGPTDIISSDNGFGTLTDPFFKEILDNYQVLSIPLALLHDGGLAELADILNVVAKGKRLSVAFPMLFKNSHNEKYLDLLRKRLQYFKGMLTEVDFDRIYVTYNMIDENMSSLNRSDYALAQDLEYGIEKVVEIPFVHSRKNLDNLLVVSQFQSDLQKFIDVLHSFKNTKYFHKPQPAVLDGFEFTYRDGRLYSSTVIFENFPIFTPEFEVPLPWTSASLFEFRAERYYENLIEFSEHPVCGNCCFLDNCARGDIHKLMTLFKQETCLIHNRNRYDFQ